MLHDEELYFLRAEQKSHLFRLILGLVALAGITLFGATKYHGHQKTVLKVETESAAERKWLIQAVDRSARLRSALNKADSKVSMVVEANSKPIRKGGKPIPREKWSQEQVAEYQLAISLRNNAASALDRLVSEYNKRRGAYSGKWPNNAVPPDTLTGSQ